MELGGILRLFECGLKQRLALAMNESCARLDIIEWGGWVV
jgi:hypothetical protein